MKKSAFFINVGRGETVEEKDLIEVLKNKKFQEQPLMLFKMNQLKKILSF